jgi:hypothetical protein
MGKWTRVGPSRHNNCTDFAFEGYDDLLFVNEIDDLLDKAKRRGWTETSSLYDADVVLYGAIDHRNVAIAYSHAIRRVGLGWEEVYGNDHNRWDEHLPPTKHGNNVIVALLRRPSGRT